MSNIDSYIHKGTPLEVFIRIKPEPYQRQDLKIYDNKISLLDQYDMPRDEFITNGAIFEQADAFRINFDHNFSKYITALVQGVNYSLITFGSKSSGKTFALEGNTSEDGLYSLFISNIFYALESKQRGLIEEASEYTKVHNQIIDTSFSFKVKMKYIEIKDESVSDLLQKFNYYRQPVQLVYNDGEGYNVSGAAWVVLQNANSFGDVMAEAMKLRSYYDYNKVNKSCTMLIFDIEQVLESKTTKTMKYINSRAIFWDLPSADLLCEHYRSQSNTVEYKNMYAFHNMITELAKSHTNALPTIYENSVLTKLMKEYIGGNGLCSAIFTLMHSNFTVSNIVFKVMKIISNLQSFPITNNSNTFCLFKKYRVEIGFFNKFSNTNSQMTGGLRPPVIPKGNTSMGISGIDVGNKEYSNEMMYGNSNLQQVQSIPQVSQVPNVNNNTYSNSNINPSSDLMRRIQDLSEDKIRLQDQLRSMEDELISIKRDNTKTQLQYEQVKDLVDGDRYDVTDKLQHIENDLNENTEILAMVDKLHSQLREEKAINQKMEEEISNLKSNNSHLSDEMNKLTMEFSNFKTNAENEMYNLKELLNATKNELDFARAEADKFRKIQSDLLIEIDEMNGNFKRQLEDKEREIEIKMLEISQNEKRKLESELREVTRKIEELGQENFDLNKVVDEMKKVNNKLTLQNKEMRSSMRDYLSKGFNNSNKDNENMNENDNENYNENDEEYTNQKQILLRSYNERENQLLEQVQVEQALVMDLKEKLRKMKMYGRKVRNIALDFYPVNEQLPEIILKDINVYIEEAENESLIQFLEFEKETLRKRNAILEVENRRLKEKIGVSVYEEYKKNSEKTRILPPMSKNINNKYVSYSEDINKDKLNDYKEYSESEIQYKIYEELLKLRAGMNKNNDKDNTNEEDSNTNQKISNLNNEINRLKEENDKLRVLINETSLRDPDNYSTDNPKAMMQQIQFLKNQIQQLESERAELLVRATSAEEQLKNIMAYTNETNQNYNKKILELSKRLEASEMKANRYDKRLDEDFYDRYNY